MAACIARIHVLRLLTVVLAVEHHLEEGLHFLVVLKAVLHAAECVSSPCLVPVLAAAELVLVAALLKRPLQQVPVTLLDCGVGYVGWMAFV